MSQNTPKVSIVILSWNGRKFLEQFLPSVIKTKYDNLELIVGDNASTDDSIEFVRNNYPQVKIITLTKNYGFAGGYNEVLKQVKADYYVLLNQDVEVTGNFIAPVIALMESDKGIAAAQPKLKFFNQKNQFEYAGAAGGWIDKYGYPFCRGRVFDVLETDNGQYETPAEIFWASGACLFIRTELFKSFGGFDAAFFAHMEEIDLCWRLRNGGYKIMYCPNAQVYHVGGGSLNKSDPHKTFLNFRNCLAMIVKNSPERHINRRLIARLFLDQCAAFWTLFKGHARDFMAIQKAHFQFLIHLNKWLNKRKEEKALWRNAQTTCIYDGSVALQHFINHKNTFEELK
jgi:GT2 family glycosyltransferase